MYTAEDANCMYIYVITLRKWRFGVSTHINGYHGKWKFDLQESITILDGKVENLQVRMKQDLRGSRHIDAHHNIGW